MLKKNINSTQDHVPLHLLSKDKKTNEIVQKHFYRKKIGNERVKISQLLHNFQPGFLQPEYQGDHTVKVTQQQISNSVNIQTAANMFNLDLDMGPYRCQYSLNGSTLLLTSQKGHLSLLNWREKDLLLQINLKQQIRDSIFLHNDEMFALAQENQTYIYDNRGIEIHKIQKSLGLEYLPYHFLLAIYDQKKLRYYDTSTGFIVADHVAKNPYTVMKQNKSNGIIALGSAKGVVEWWTPGVGTPAVKLFAGAKIDGIGFYKGYMYTASDKLKVWDTRMLKVLHEQDLARRINSLQVSQSGIVSLNYGYKIEFLKDLHVKKQNNLYLRHQGGCLMTNSKFIPFEDLVGIGTNKGFNCIAVPGSGTPYYDTFQNNPFESKKQKRQALVHKLLQKLAPQTITIDPNILGNINKISRQVLEEDQKKQKQQSQRKRIEAIVNKKKAKGKGKISKKINRRSIQHDKIRRAQLTKLINTRLWARRAELKKKETEGELIKQMEADNIGIADLLSKKTKIIKKTQKIVIDDHDQ